MTNVIDIIVQNERVIDLVARATRTIDVIPRYSLNKWGMIVGDITDQQDLLDLIAVSVPNIGAHRVAFGNPSTGVLTSSSNFLYIEDAYSRVEYVGTVQFGSLDSQSRSYVQGTGYDKFSILAVAGGASIDMYGYTGKIDYTAPNHNFNGDVGINNTSSNGSKFRIYNPANLAQNMLLQVDVDNAYIISSGRLLAIESDRPINFYTLNNHPITFFIAGVERGHIFTDGFTYTVPFAAGGGFISQADVNNEIGMRFYENHVSGQYPGTVIDRANTGEVYVKTNGTEGTGGLVFSGNPIRFLSTATWLNNTLYFEPDSISRYFNFDSYGQIGLQSGTLIVHAAGSTNLEISSTGGSTIFRTYANGVYAQMDNGGDAFNFAVSVSIESLQSLIFLADSLNNQFIMTRYTNTTASNFMGTSIPLQHAMYFQNKLSGGERLGRIIFGTKEFYHLSDAYDGPISAHYGFKSTAAGFRIDQLGNLHTDNTIPFEVVGDSAFRNALLLTGLQVGNAGLASGSLYKDTAANIAANGDKVIGIKS